MNRRKFIALAAGPATGLLAGASGWPIAARSQQQAMRRIGQMFGYAESDPEGRSRLEALQEKLKELGWIEGRNIELVIRRTLGRPELISSMAAELASMRPDVLLVGGAPSLVAMHRETKDIPIVFVFVSDPLGMGEIESLARPGGNVTGFTAFEPSLGGKWVEMLKQVALGLRRIGVLLNPKTTPNSQAFVRSAETAATALSLSINVLPVETDQEIDRAIEQLAQDAGAGLILVPDPFTAARRNLIVAATQRHRLPFIAPFKDFAIQGSLGSLGVNARDEFRRAATYIDRILRGAKPGELPVQQPTTFELVINLRTAKALGLTVPPLLLARADEVIE